MPHSPPENASSAVLGYSWRHECGRLASFPHTKPDPVVGPPGRNIALNRFFPACAAFHISSKSVSRLAVLILLPVACRPVYVDSCTPYFFSPLLKGPFQDHQVAVNDLPGSGPNIIEYGWFFFRVQIVILWWCLPIRARPPCSHSFSPGSSNPADTEV